MHGSQSNLGPHHVGRLIGKLGEDDPASEAITQVLDGLRLGFSSDAEAAHS